MRSAALALNLFAAATVIVGGSAVEAVAVDTPSPRVTETVALVQRCLPAVVAIRAFTPTDKPDVQTINFGSGSVIHPAGYILTNNHVVKTANRSEVLFSDGKTLNARVVANYSIEDMAILKVDSAEPLPTLPLGRSHDLLLGEPVLVIGTPAGLQHSVSTGIISGLGRATTTQDAVLPWMIQTSAAVNGGNSGGPLINALGEQIGIVTSKKDGAENINFAIAIDRVWQLFPRIVSAEVRSGFTLGCEVDVSHAGVRLTQVVPNSPAEKAGLKAGDTVKKLGGLELRHSVDYHLALLERKPGDKLTAEIVREGQPMSLEVELAVMPLIEAAEPQNLTAGLKLEFYPGSFERLPDFTQIKPTIEHGIPTVSLNTITGGRDLFALRFTGFVKVPSDGLYTFYSLSDDGSRVTLSNRLIVDNDGLHGAFEGSGLVRLKAGYHPIVVEFFEKSGGENLKVSWEGPNLAKQEVPADAFYRPADAVK